MTPSRTSRIAALASCLAVLSLLSGSAAFVFQRSLSPGYGGGIAGKHEVGVYARLRVHSEAVVLVVIGV